MVQDFLREKKEGSPEVQLYKAKIGPTTPIALTAGGVRGEGKNILFYGF
jgi:hypothetical protein